MITQQVGAARTRVANYRRSLDRVAMLVTEASEAPARSELQRNLARVDEALDLLLAARVEMGEFASAELSKPRLVAVTA